MNVSLLRCQLSLRDIGYCHRNRSVLHGGYKKWTPGGVKRDDDDDDDDEDDNDDGIKRQIFTCDSLKYFCLPDRYCLAFVS